MPNIKTLVEEALEASGMGAQRPLKMTQDDFIRLLSEFNSRGVHFA
eukprot:COSAG05_NODE_47_length_24712_cov_26.673844_21_plen_46_part_00